MAKAETERVMFHGRLVDAEYAQMIREIVAEAPPLPQHVALRLRRIFASARQRPATTTAPAAHVAGAISHQHAVSDTPMHRQQVNRDTA